MTKYKKLPKIHAVCGNDPIREALSYVKVTKSHILATNAHIAVLHPTNTILPQEVIEQLPDECYIYKDSFKVLEKHITLSVQENSIVVHLDKYNIAVPFRTIDNYPDVLSALKKRTPEQTDTIAIKAKFLATLEKAIIFPNEPKGVKLSLCGNNAIHVTPIHNHNGGYGIIMPLYIDKQTITP